MRFHSKMKVKAVATPCNDEQGGWKVKIITTDISKDNGKKRRTLKRVNKRVYVDYLCDEFVLPAAILEHNGLNHKTFFN